jgi:hypothetical protein
MPLVYTRQDSGLVVAEHASDEASVARALRDHDSDLRLVRQLSESLGALVWKVYRYAGSERPAEFVCAWTDRSGTPLPLSHRLVDMVKGLDRNSRAPVADADTLNARRKERAEKEVQRHNQDLIDDHLPRVGRSPVLHRSQSLRMARDKQRAKGRKV